MLNTKSLLALVVASLLVGGCKNEKPEDQVNSAKEYLQKSDTKAATIQLKNALQQKPDLAEARFLLGTVFRDEGNFTAAEIEFRKALTAQYPASLVVPELARAMMVIGQGKKLVEEFGTVQFNQSAADANLQTTLAAAYGELGNQQSAEVALTAALTADPDYGPALLVRSRQKAAHQDFDDALRIIEKVVAKDTGNFEAWKLKGDILQFSKNDTDGALLAYKKSIDINPKFIPSHSGILTILLQKGKNAEAAKQLDQLKKVAPKNLEVKYFESFIAYQNKDYKSAKDLVQQLLRSAPNNGRILNLAGAIELQMKSYSQAEIYLLRSIKMTPDLGLSHRLLVATYASSGQSAKALSALNDNIKKFGLQPNMYSLAGEVYLQNGDPKKAEEYFSKALALQPDNAKNQTALAVSHLAGGKTESALDELENISKADDGTLADLSLISAYLKQADYPKALRAVDTLEAKRPDKPVAANLRGRIYLAQKDTAAARKSFERALAIDPAYFAAAASLANLDMVDKKPQDAKKRFERLLEKSPKNGPALLALAQLASVNGASKEDVAAQLSKAIDANPTDATPRVLLIELHLRNKDTAQAISVAQNAVTALPDSPELLISLGRAQMQSGDFGQAIAAFTKLANLQPLSPQPHVRLAEAYLAKKDNSGAEQSLRKALEIQPDFAEAQRGLIILNLQSKNYAGAIKIAHDVQKQQPQSALGWLLEGDIWIAQKKWESSIAAYKTGLQRSPAPDVAIKLHAVLIASDKAVEADRMATSWMTDHPKDVVFQSHMAELSLARKDNAAAEKFYLDILKIQPNNAVVLNNLAWITGQLRKEGAIAYAEKANTLVLNQPDFMDTWAMLLSDGTQYSKAIDLQNKAIKLDPSNVRLRMNLARIYIKSGDKTKAKTELDALMKSGAGSPYAAEVSTLLKSL